ncbi:MAG: phage portal protein [Clostridia bacterium]|nr:phage portal protein [Clostridia bacterium]
MSLFDKIFGRAPKPTGAYEGIFKVLSGYQPHFTTWGGGVYESELIRASINAIATHISKLKVETEGPARPGLQNKLRHGPNEWQTWSQFLYRLATVLYVHNTAFIIPVTDEYGETSGIYAPLPTRCEIVQYGGKPYLRYEFRNGQKAAIELELCGILTRMQYRDDFFGESNHALLPTMDLIHIQNQGIEEGVKSAASYRFMAQLNNFAKAEDLAKERKRFTRENFAADSEGGGVLLFPNTYANIKQIDVKPWVVDAAQMKVIRDNVFEYFGTNEDILQNRAFGDAWSAFYEGVVEAFAIQFSEVMTRMLFTFREQSTGNFVQATANRLQYLSNADKLNVSAQLLDRGIMSINDVRDIWNLPPVEDGDVRIIRGEYYNAGDKVAAQEGEENG